jgi:hypothetical protein
LVKDTSRTSGINSTGHKESAELAEPTETPEKLFARCEAKARVADQKIYAMALSILAGVLTFRDPLFGPEPPLDATPSTDDSYSMKLRRIIQQASRYRDLVQWMKEYPGREQRWLLLALWLKEERICEPVEFLPVQVYENLTGEKRAALRVSIKDVQHYCQVEAWTPYFERLLKDRRKTESRDPERDLERAGYTIEAISAALNKRLAIPAVCEWLADILHKDAFTLRNAHSRISRNSKSQIP